jgi:hypothetical protein
MKPRFHHLLLVQCDWDLHRHLCGIALNKSQSRSHSLRVCAHPWTFSEPILRKTCDSLA